MNSATESIKLPFVTMLLLMSFASVNAVLFTPALPAIAEFFSISEDVAQSTITWYLIGYALGQLIYGPLANRFGRKPALYAGIGLQIIASLLCVLPAFFHQYWMLIVARFLLALGAGVGLKMTFTLINECYEPKIASQKIAYLMLAFAITPGLAVALGGFLVAHFDWTSCFYAGMVYGLMLLFLVTRLPETQLVLNYDALKLRHLVHEYLVQFKNVELIRGALLMGGATSFVYVFAAVAPFVAIDLMRMPSEQYGMANLLPPIGLFCGSLVSARLAIVFSLERLIKSGLLLVVFGIIWMLVATLAHISLIVSLFLPMILIYFGLSFVLANASVLAMSHVTDKAHGAAVMSFINMGSATLLVLSLGLFSITQLLLPLLFAGICIAMLGIIFWEGYSKNSPR